MRCPLNILKPIVRLFDTHLKVFRNHKASPTVPFFTLKNTADEASFTGSHIHFVDYDRNHLATFMDAGAPSSAMSMVKGAGEAVTTMYNLKREKVGPRNRDGNGLNATTSNVHESNVNMAGEYIVGMPHTPSKADWLMQSLCSAHLEVKHQWGDGKGVEDNLFITNEEWINYADGSTDVIGLPVHVLNLATGELWATAVFTLGGHEKIVEVNSGSRDYVAWVPSGYSGNFGSGPKTVGAAARNQLYTRTDGNPYVWPQDIVPTRLYIGKKNTNKDGNADTRDFMARNGFEYGALYGFAVDCSVGTRDAWHATAAAGDTVQGEFVKLR